MTKLKHKFKTNKASQVLIFFIGSTFLSEFLSYDLSNFSAILFNIMFDSMYLVS